MTDNGKEQIAQQRRRLSIPIPAMLAAALTCAAKAEDRSVASYVRIALTAAVRADEMRKFSQR
jgi:hypothetical protein